MKITTLGLAIVVVGCAEPSDSADKPVASATDRAVAEAVAPESSGLAAATATGLVDIEVRNVAGGPTQTLQLLPSKSAPEIEPLGPFIVDAGYECNRATSARQLQENGKPLDVFKIDCADGNSYQATMMNDSSFIKPWTGNLIGE